MMFQFLLYLHVLSAILMGAYLVMPFLSGKLASLSGSAQYGFLNVLSGFNRAGQFALILAFLTGGYMVGKGSYSVLWMVLAVVLLARYRRCKRYYGQKNETCLSGCLGRQDCRPAGCNSFAEPGSGYSGFCHRNINEIP